MTESLPEKQQEIINLLTRKGAMTAKEMSKLIDRNSIGIRFSLRMLKKKGMVHISDYAERDRPNGARPAEWDIGNRPDAPRPKAKTNKLKKKDYRVRNAAVLKIRSRPNEYQSLGVWRGL